MNVLIFEPTHSGHRFNYVRMLIPALHELGVNISLATTPEARVSVEYGVHLRPLESKFSYVELHPQNPTVKQTLKVRHDILALFLCIHEQKPDHVYIMTADGRAQMLGLLSLLRLLKVPHYTTIEGILFKGSGAYASTSAIRKLYDKLLNLILRYTPLSRFHYVDPLAYDWVRTHNPYLALRSSLLPDPISTALPVPADQARAQLGIPTEGKYIGLAGALKPRKGLDHLVRAFVSAGLGSDCYLLLAGKQAPAVKRCIEENTTPETASQIIAIDRYVSNDEFWFALCAMDVVCVPYPKHRGSSGILLSAAAAGKPVLATQFGWIGAFTKEYGLGQTVDVHDQNMLVAGIRASLQRAHQHTPSAKWNQYSKSLTQDHFTNSLTTLLQERLITSSLKSATES